MPLPGSDPAQAWRRHDAPASEVDDAYDPALFDKLRVLRRRLATQRNVPPYVIFGDRTLRQMATYLPQSPRGLSRISGVGAVKLEQLGDEFLSEIVDYAREHAMEERGVPSRQRGVPSSFDEIRQQYPRAYEKWSTKKMNDYDNSMAWGVTLRNRPNSLTASPVAFGYV